VTEPKDTVFVVDDDPSVGRSTGPPVRSTRFNVQTIVSQSSS